MIYVFDPEALRELMDEKELDAVSFAEQLGCAATTVANWLAGVSRPRGASLTLVAKMLNCKVSDLQYGDRQ